jgi:hypothetical protein
MIARPRDDKQRRYVCPGRLAGTCGKAFILAEPLEELVTEVVLHRLDAPEFDKALHEHERAGTATQQEAASGQLREDRRRLEQLAVMWADHELTRAEYLKPRERLVARIEQAERSQARQNGTGAVRAVAGSARKRWPDMSFDQRRAVLRAMLATVTIGPGRRGFNRFDPSRVYPEWKL